MELIARNDVVREIDKIRKLTDEQKDGVEIAREIVVASASVAAIPIEWLRKELVEMLYDDEISNEMMKIFYLLIARWEKNDG